MQGGRIRTHQTRFWPYDFAYIPVETISAIYERFLNANEDREGAFYTARFRAEMVLDTALEGARELIGKTFWTPPAGRGSFWSDYSIGWPGNGLGPIRTRPTAGARRS